MDFRRIMHALILRFEGVLSWTIFAPLVRSLRQREQQRIAGEMYDRERIDRLFSDIVRLHGDLLR